MRRGNTVGKLFYIINGAFAARRRTLTGCGRIPERQREERGISFGDAELLFDFAAVGLGEGRAKRRYDARAYSERMSGERHIFHGVRAVAVRESIAAVTGNYDDERSMIERCESGIGRHFYSARVAGSAHGFAAAVRDPVEKRLVRDDAEMPRL